MTDEELVKHCMCGCMYLEAECPNCNKVTDADRIEALTAERDAWKEQHAAEALGLHVQMQRAEAAEAKLAKAVEALTPSGDTKAEYMGEFCFSQTMIGEDGDEVTVKTYVPWTTIKEIMAAILARATLAEIEGSNAP